MKCIQCKTEFIAKRSDSKYCSPNCRKLAFRDSGTDNMERLNGTANGTLNIPDKYKRICGICNKPLIEHSQCFITVEGKPVRTSMPYHYWSIATNTMSGVPELIEHY